MTTYIVVGRVTGERRDRVLVVEAATADGARQQFIAELNDGPDSVTINYVLESEGGVFIVYRHQHADKDDESDPGR